MICGRGGLERPDRPRPGAAVHRLRPGVRLRDIAARTGVTERTAYGIVTDLTEAGYVVKHEDGRRNRCQIQAHLPLPETDSRERAIGEIPALLAGADDEATG
jgi:DNA-binding IclR family transcriptional regulator